MNKEQINKTFFEDLYKLQMNKINEEEKETEEEIEYTCCNVEMTQEIKEVGLCPKCLEHI
jgi:hypothetical protein